MINKVWKRFFIYELSLMIFAIINIFLVMLNGKICGIEIPKKIIEIMFFSAIGLYSGFMLCKREYKKAIDKINAG